MDKTSGTQKKLQKTLQVSGIKSGTVIDHMAPGSAIKVLELFDLVVSYNNSDLSSKAKVKSNQELTQVTVGICLKCKDGRFKDIIKLTDRNLTDQELANIAVFAPNATINLIDNYAVVKKFQVSVPDRLIGILKCPNRACITNHEDIKTLFLVSSSGVLSGCELTCNYCSHSFAKSF